MNLDERIQKARSASERDANTVRESLARKAAAASSAPSAAITPDGLSAGQSGFRGAREQYLHNTGWVYSAVRLVAQRVAAQPIRAARKAPGKRPGSMRLKAMQESLPMQYKSMADGLEPLDQHILLDTLADPSDLATSWSLVFSVVASLEITGRALLWATSEKGKRLILHLPTSWATKVSVNGGPWTIHPAGRTTPIDIPAAEVVHFFYPDPSDPHGALSPLQQLARAVTADEAIEDSQLSAHRQGIRPGVIIKAGRLKNANTGGEGMRPHLTPDQRNQLITAIRNGYQGTHRRGEPLIVDGLIEDVIPFDRTIQEMDFLGSSKLTKERILQGFGVNPILLGAIEGANRASAVAADEIFVANKIGPITEQLSLAMTEWLGPLFAAKNEKLVVWIERAKAHDEDLTFRYRQLLALRGKVTGNEARGWAGLPPIDGEDELPDSPHVTAAGIAAAEKWYRNRDPYTGRRLEE
jgi:phage portal protein BeeE